MTIDFHAHLGPEDPAAPPFLRHLFDVDGYLGLQAEAGIQLTLLSYALDDSDAGLDEAKRQHAFLADTVGTYSGRLAAFATVDPFGGESWLEEAAQALQSGFVGLCFPTSRHGRYLDSPEAQDALAFANDHGAVVFLHPSDAPIGVERAGDVILRDWIGRPYDTGITLSRLILAGTLGRYPGIRLVAAHSGGPLPMLIGRLDSVYETFERRAAMFGGGGPPGGGPPGGPPSPGGPPGGGPPGGPPGGGPPFGPPGPAVPAEAKLSPSLEGGKPSDRLSQIYLDTASYHPASIRAAIDTVGVDRVVLGTDYPPAGRSPKPVLDLIEGMELPQADRDKILSGNARQLIATNVTPAAS